MKSLKIQPGTKIGKLTVLERTIKRGSHFYYRCACACGKEKEIRKDHLAYGATKSCGCLKDGRIRCFEDFLEHTTLDPETGCWEWNYSTNGRGYARCQWRGIRLPVHRLALSLFQGDEELNNFDSSTHCMHLCDNPKCCNPIHLKFGTPQDNSDDKVKKGRQAKGSRDGNSKLTEDEALRIYHSSENQKELAKSHGVCTSTVEKIKSGEVWSWLTKETRYAQGRLHRSAVYHNPRPT